MSEIKCLDCRHGTLTNIGSLHCAVRRWQGSHVLIMNPQHLVPTTTGYTRASRVEAMIDTCLRFKAKSQH